MAGPARARVSVRRSLQNSAAVTDLKAILGHSNLATAKVYARMVDERMRASIRALDYGMGRVEAATVNEAMCLGSRR